MNQHPQIDIMKGAFRSGQRGFALVLVLAFVVLLTVAILAFFSTALIQRKVADSSSKRMRTQLFAQGALDSIVGDLKQEIADPLRSQSTNIVTGPVTTELYWPKAATNAVPAYSGINPIFSNGIESDGLNNLVKKSARGTAFYPGGIVRAAGDSSTNASRNGRFVSLSRWNKPLFMSATSLQDSGPAPGVKFTAPDWILVARDGSNPQAVSTNVIGRYAYVIYNEGGLLDVNAAGFPSEAVTSPPTGITATNQTTYKNSLSYADLTRVGLDQTLHIDPLVKWRNTATLDGATGAAASRKFYSFASQNQTGFLTSASTNLSAGQSDHLFISRQQLLEFFNRDLGASNNLNLLNSLQYLGSFSRSLNQPSYWPESGRPKVMGPGLNSSADAYDGGNTGYGNESLINPVFASVRVVSPFTRNDGSSAVVGEPLINRRFALNRLAWITCKGPSASLGTGDPLITQYLQNGITQSLLNEGSDVNVRKYFGLTWTPGPGSGGIGGHWTYAHGLPNTVGTLDAVDSVGREPDFFEMLKAALNVGSLGKDYIGVGDSLSHPVASFLMKRNTRIDNHILQIGANIIAQVSPDSFPVHLVFNDGVYNRSFWGVEDLPYFYGAGNLNVLVRKASPTPIYTTQPPPDQTPAVTLLDPGLVVSMQVPVIWNPNTQRTSGGTVIAPAALRIVCSGFSVASPQVLAASPSSFYYSILQESATAYPPAPYKQIKAPWSIGTYNATLGTIEMPSEGSPGTTAMKFNNDPLLYREPTPLMRVGLPNGSNLVLDGQNAMILSGSADWSAGVPEIQTGEKFIGMYIGQYPSRFNLSGTTYTVQSSTPVVGGFGYTYSLEYQVDGAWVPYQQAVINSIWSQNYVSADIGLGSTNNYKKSAFEGWTNQPGLNFFDPRSQRYGAWGDLRLGAFLDSAKTSIETVRAGTGPGIATHSFYIGAVGGDMSLLRAYSSFVEPTAPFRIIDADQVIRPGMGAYTSSDSTIGFPLATSANQPLNGSNRPVILNRPFRTVAELGYVFQDMPFRNLDFSTPQSGSQALLDVFCINEGNRSGNIVAGKVDLNTRQVPVIEAILAGAYRDDLGTSTISVTEARILAETLVRRTSVGPASGVNAGVPQPLANVSALVGNWVSGSKSTAKFDGFSAENSISASASPENRVQRFRESSVRSLAASGMAGTWNLMIDLVAQTGRYLNGTTDLSDFMVEGEQRYWAHVAIDRQTGNVIDIQIEQVTE